LAVGRLQLHKYVPAVMNTHAATEELLDAVFSVLLYVGKGM
jgi:hypothetical protein